MKLKMFSFVMAILTAIILISGCSAANKSENINKTADKLIKDAIKANWIFYVEPLKHNDISVSKYHGIYYQVTDSRFKSLDEIKECLNGIFTDKMTERLLSLNVYLMESNKLYTTDISGGTKLLWDDYSLNLKDLSEYEAIFDLKVKKVLSTESNEYVTKRVVMQKTDSKWKISEFDFDY